MGVSPEYGCDCDVGYVKPDSTQESLSERGWTNNGSDLQIGLERIGLKETLEVVHLGFCGSHNLKTMVTMHT